MHPAQPDQPDQPDRGDPAWLSADGPPGAAEVGAFRQGSAGSQWALARYLVGRAIGESVGTTLLLVAGALVVLAVLAHWPLHLTFLVVLLVLAAIAVLLLRAALLAVLRRLTAAGRYGPIEERLRALVSDTRSDVLRELRRIGLPSHLVTLPLLALRLAGRRRTQTLSRLRAFEVEHAVPAARVDELHLLLRRTLGRDTPGRGTPGGGTPGGGRGPR